MVSVIIPVYNGEEFISDAIKSVINQSCRNWELIIIDDGSSDDSEKKIKKYLEDEKIRYIKHSENKGIPVTRNEGVRSSKGEFIAFLDQDDIWYPHKLKKSVEAFKNSDDNVGVIFSDFELKMINGAVRKRSLSRFDPKKISKENFIKVLFLKKNIIKSVSQTLIRRKCFKETGFLDEELYGSDDLDFWMRILKKYSFRHIPDFLVKVRRHHKNASLKGRYIMIEQYIEKIMPEIIKLYPFLKKLKNRKMSQLYYDYGVYLLMDGKIKEAKKYFLKSVKENEINYKAWIRLLLPEWIRRLLRN